LQLEAKKLLFDVREAGRLITLFIEERSFDDYLEDPMLRSAVERQLEIIGEAIGKLGKIAPEIADAIPESRKIVAFRNVLAHGYGFVAHDVVWGILESKLATLLNTVQALLPPELEGS
jgi:uncharacterized protein with HEPN domain